MEMLNQIQKFVQEINANIKIHTIEKDSIIFENRVFLNCFYCSKYDQQWTCPPRIPKLDYKKTIKEYDNILILEISKPDL